MKIYIGSDHAAFDEKEYVKNYLAERYEVVDCGPSSAERCDYPDFAAAVAKHVGRGEGLGVLLCGSGIGISMAANRYQGVRAALVRTTEEAKLAKGHNDANILCVGARISSQEDIYHMIDAWLEAEFEEGRHIGRIEKFNKIGESVEA